MGIGIDKATALIVSGNRARVLGTGSVSIYDAADRGGTAPVVLHSGDTYDLSARRKQ